MHNKVVFRAAKALQEAGFETLRINFRGVGLSTGKYDAGEGECEDAVVALDYLLNDQPQAREVIVGGFSFGSIVGLRVGCSDNRVHRLIAIGFPARSANLDFMKNCTKSKLFIHGVKDTIAPLQPLEEFLNGLPANNPYSFVRLEGAGHFFDDQAEELKQAIKDFVA